MFGDWSANDDYTVGENSSIKMVWEEIIEGRVFAYDQSMNTLVLQVATENNGTQFRIIKTDKIGMILLQTKQQQQNNNKNPLITIPSYEEELTKSKEGMATKPKDGGLPKSKEEPSSKPKQQHSNNYKRRGGGR